MFMFMFKAVELTLATCRSRLRLDEIVAPSNRTWSLYLVMHVKHRSIQVYRRPRFSRGGGSGVERFAFLCDLVTIAGNVQEELED